MVSDRRWAALRHCLVLFAGGLALGKAVDMGIVGVAVVVALVAGWATWRLCDVHGNATVRYSLSDPSDAADDDDSQIFHHLLLDAAPTPLICSDSRGMRALNSAARRLFNTDARILPLPPALADPEATHLKHAGRRYRINRVETHYGSHSVTLAALMDVESERLVAEANAGREFAEVLGHELLNGLAPIVSLADSARMLSAESSGDPELLEEILSTLARRAEGLRKFAESYRQLACIRAPIRNRHDVAEFVDDLERLFRHSWPGVRIDCAVADGLDGSFDRDQLHQAIWALLHNAAEAAIQDSDPWVKLESFASDRTLQFAVSDSGDGVAAEMLPHIFKPFRTTKVNGSGIGLTLAGQIAREHGGRVEMAGARPTRFHLSLPRPA